MRRALFLLLVALPRVASAAESPWPTAVEIGARVGYGIPLGEAARDLPMRDALAAKVELQLDGGYRLRDWFYLGGYVAYAYGAGSPRSRLFCPAPTTTQPGREPDCRMRDIRFGANAHFHIAPRGPIDPWIGLGFGYEVLTRQEDNTSLRGWEFLNLQGGVDVALGTELLVGPFFAASFARYTLTAWTTQYFERIATIPAPADHVWITAGLRAAFRTLPRGS
jgi:hypothetical protein